MGKNLKGKELGTGLRQKPNGVYSGRFTNKFGKRVELYDRSLSVLKQKLNSAIHDDYIGHGTKDDSIKLTDWFKNWIEVHKYNVIRNSTRAYYLSLFEKHIKPTLGKKKLKDITQLNIKALLKDLDKKGYHYETKNKIRIMLLDMFDKAMIDDYVLKNPCRGIRLVRDEKKDIRVLSRDEQLEFFDCCKNTFYDNLFVVAVTTGLRQGELCALTNDDIDFDKKEISITKTLIYQKLEGDSGKTFHINPPKTKTSKRKIPMNAQCEIALKKQFIQRNIVMTKAAARPLEGFEDLLFTTKVGTPICDQIMIDAIKRIIKEINLCRGPLEQFEYFSPHCFRHSFATRCFEAGIAPKTVQHYLGHATIQMTLDLYTHVLEGQQQESMKKLEAVLDEVAVGGGDIVEQRFQEAMLKKNNLMPFGQVG